jgi:DNA repair protein RecO (recombination protein O)
MGHVETEALVLRTYKLADADKIVVCLTREGGVVRGTARGARRLKSKFGASLEVWTRVALSYYEKEGRELVSIRQAEILQSYFDLAAESLEAVAALDYLGELIIEFAPPHEPFEKLFRLAKVSVETISNSSGKELEIRATIRYFEVWILKLSGFFPDLRFCARCRRTLDKKEFLYLKGNNLFCGECREGTEKILSAETYSHLRAIERMSPNEFAQSATEESLGEVQLLTERLITRILERAPRGRNLYTHA